MFGRIIGRKHLPISVPNWLRESVDQAIWSWGKQWFISDLSGGGISSETITLLNALKAGAKGNWKQLAKGEEFACPFGQSPQNGWQRSRKCQCKIARGQVAGRRFRLGGCFEKSRGRSKCRFSGLRTEAAVAGVGDTAFLIENFSALPDQAKNYCGESSCFPSH